MGSFKDIIERQREKLDKERERLEKIKNQSPSAPSQFGIRNFYNTDDPLNYVPISTLHRNRWESDEAYDKRLQAARDDSIRQSENKLKQNAQELDKAQRVANTNYVKDLIGNIKNNTPTPYEQYERDAVSSLLQEKKLLERGVSEDGQYYEIHSNDLANPFLYDIDQEQQREDFFIARDYFERGNQLRDLYSSILDQDYKDEDYFDKHPNERSLLENDSWYSDYMKDWKNLDDNTRETVLLAAYLENNYGNVLTQIADQNPEIAEMLESPENQAENYKTVAALILKQLQGVKSIKGQESADIKEALEGEGTFLGKLGKAFDYLSTKGGESIQEGLNQKFSPLGLWNQIGDLWSGAAAWALGSVGTLSKKLITGGLGWAYQSTFSDAEDKDLEINTRTSEFFRKKVQTEYDNLRASTAPQDIQRKQYLLRLFDEASEDKLLGSVAYRANQGTYLTELSDDEKLMLALQYEAQAKMFGAEAAQQQLRSFWQDRVATRQTWSDAVSNTTGQFATTAAADVLSAAAILANIGQKGTWQEGYVDNLVRNNSLMRLASDIMETGSFDEAEQAEYKELGVNMNAALRTSAQEDSIFTWDDLQDAIGQYGFTVGSTIVSMGGSAALRGAGWTVTRSALSNSKAVNWLGKAMTYTNSYLSKDGRARAIYRSLLKSGEAARNSTEGLELLNRLKSTGLYRGNLIIDATIGTAEGGLEAIGTYDTFKEEMTQKYASQMQQEINDAVAAIQASPGGDMEARIAQKTAEIQDKYKDIVNYIEENAADAAALNFISNSAINGFLAVGMKELTLSKDGRLAARQFLGKNKKLNDYIKLVSTEGTNGIMATVRDEYLKNGGMAGMAWKTIKKAAENISGEALEEFSQGVSDAFSRAIMEEDLKHYINTVYNGGGIDAYTMDLGSMVKQGLDALVENAASRETLYSAYMGGLSSMIGGVNIFGGAAKAWKRIKQYADDVTVGKLAEEGFMAKAKEFAKMGRDVTTGFAQNAFAEGYRDIKNERETAQALADSINEWFHNTENKELLTHMGGALGFKHSMQSHLANGDLFQANNDKLGVAIENAFMLEVLSETERGRAYIASMYNNAHLMDNSQFDENGKLITDINAISPEVMSAARQELQEQQNAQRQSGEKPTPVTDEQVVKHIQDKISAAQSLITSFRNMEGQKTRDLNMSDQEVAQRISKNLSEFSELRQEIAKARKQLAFILHDDNIDPMTEKVLVHAMLTQKDAKQRYANLKERINKAINSEELSEDQKAALQQRANMSKDALDLIVQYGSIKKAEEALTKLSEQVNTAAENSRDKKYDSKERHTYKQEYKALEREKKYLKEKLKFALQNLTDEEKQALQEATFTEGDMQNMSEEQIATIFNNKKTYSAAQQNVIDNFAKIVQSGINNTEKADINLTSEEVENDLKDLVKLKTKARLYDDHLLDLLKNSKGVNKEVASARAKKREDILSYIYKDDLELKEGETFRDLVDRLDKKVQTLLEEGKVQDADILKKLINRNPKVMGIKRNFNTLHRMMIDTFFPARNDPNYYKGICGLRTLVDQGMSMELIKKWFSDGSNLGEIKKALRRKTNLLGEGGYLLNYFIQKEGKEPIDVDDDKQLNTVIAAMNKLINMATAVEQQRERKPEPGKTQDPNAGTRGNDAAIKLPPNSNKEVAVFKVSSLADLDPSSTKFRTLNEDYAMNDNLKAYSQLALQGRGGELVLIARNIPGIGPIILVATSGNSDQAKGAFQAGKLYYQAIGFIELDNNNQSQTLQESLDLVKTDNDTIVLGAVDQRHITDSRPRNPDLNLEDESKYPTLKGQIDKEDNPEERVKRREEVAENIINGKWITETPKIGNVEAPSKTYFLDKWGHPVILKVPSSNTTENNEELNAVWDLPVTGSSAEETLAQLFSRLGDNLEEATKILSKSRFFRNIYDFWTKITPKLDDEDFVKYAFHDYFNNFIYMGTGLKTSVDKVNNKVTIEFSEPSVPPIEFDFPITQGEEVRAAAVTKMLYTIWKTQSGEGPRSLAFVRPQIPSCRPTAPKQVREILRHSAEDLIELGVLYGNASTIVDRNLEVDNPYFKLKKSDKSQMPTDADGGQTRDPEEPPVKQQVIDRSKKAIKERLEKAKQIINSLTEVSKKFALPNKDAKFYEKDGKKSSRVTTVEYSTTEGVDQPTFDDQQKTKGKIASAHGTFVDNVVRNFFEIMYSDRLPANWSTMSNQKKAMWLLDAIKQSDDFKTEDGGHAFPLGYENQIRMPEFISNLMAVKQLMDDNGWTVYPKDIKAFGQLAVGDTGKALNVAGTLDLLVVDSEGIFHIIDMKSKFNNAFYENGVEVSRNAWEIQVATYQQLLQQQYPGMVFGENYILPIKVSYIEPYASPEDIVIGENGMSVFGKNGPIGGASNIPEFQVEFGGKKDDVKLEDLLIPLQGINHSIRLLEEKLTEEQRDALVPLSPKATSPIENASTPTTPSTAAPTTPPTPAASTPLQEEQEEEQEESSEETRSEDEIRADQDAQGSFFFASSREDESARFTDFMNTRIKPLVSVRMSTLQKTAHRLKKAIIGRRGFRILVTKDLANTFCQGSIEKLKSIVGNTPYINMQNVVNKLTQHFQKQLSKKEEMIKAVNNNHIVSLALKQLMEGTISEDTFLDTLTEKGIQAHLIDAYINWKSAENPQEYAKDVLANLEKSKDYDDTVFSQQLQAIQSVYDDMSAKLQFLQSRNAAQLLKQRVLSVERAVFNHEVEEIKIDSKGTIEKLRTSKQGETFGALKLLEDIIATTPNQQVKALAQMLHRNLKYSSLGILVTTDSDLLPAVEGLTDGRSITLNPKTLKSYKTTERVLLHEIIHCVVQDNPEMGDIIEGLRKEALEALSQATKIPIQELENQEYGFKDKDEFIAEFFTNYAFQARLKELSLSDQAGKSIFNRIIDAIINFFKGKNRNSNLADKLESTLEEILQADNLPSTENTRKEITVVTGKEMYEELSEEIQEAIKAKGGTAKQFNSLSKAEQDYVLRCCSF